VSTRNGIPGGHGGKETDEDARQPRIRLSLKIVNDREDVNRWAPTAVVWVLALSAGILALSVVFEKNIDASGAPAALEASWVLFLAAITLGVLGLLARSGSVLPGRFDRRAPTEMWILQLVSFLAATVLVVVVGFQLPQTSASSAPLGSATTATTAASAPAAPVISAVRPLRGRVGARVVIRGRNLLGASSVLFGGVGAAVSAESETRIVTHVPLGARSGAITVSTSVGSAQSPASFTVR
jgi:hypothetical protein